MKGKQSRHTYCATDLRYQQFGNSRALRMEGILGNTSRLGLDRGLLQKASSLLSAMIAHRRSCCPRCDFSMGVQNADDGSPPSSDNEDEFESACSTPFASAPSSPDHGSCSPAAAGSFFFFSAPSSPMHYALLTPSSPFSAPDSPSDPAVSGEFSFEFGFSTRFPAHSAAASADELFLNGQIRPMKFSSHLQRPHALASLPDLTAEEEDDDEGETTRGFREAAEISVLRRDLMLRSRSVHRRARSHSPLRNQPFLWRLQGSEREESAKHLEKTQDPKHIEEAGSPAPPVSASSRSSSSSSTSSSSSGRSSKRWVFLKDLLHWRKSESGGNGKDSFWHGISFSASKDNRSKPTPPPSMRDEPSSSRENEAAPRPATGARRQRRARPSAHDRLYTANRAQAEEMRRRTFLPYRQGILGCLWFSSRSYGAINGYARCSLNPVSSR